MRRVTDDRGTVTVIFALLFAALLGMAALAIDVGILLVKHRALQTGADAGALAVAHDCARLVAYPPAATPCTAAQALATANTYFTANTMTPTADRQLVRTNGGRVGRITVTGEVQQPPIFARFIGIANPLPVGAAAVAGWGPVLSMDTVFPLVVCKGALSPPDVGPRVLRAQPWPMLPPAADCTGAPFLPPFGWTAPDDPVACTSDLDLLPPTIFAVSQPDNEPGNLGCVNAIDQLHDDIDTGSAADRTRILAVYDHQSGWFGARPAYAFVAFEFTGAKLAGRISHVPGPWAGACDLADPVERCIEGIVRVYIPPEDGPIVDPTVMALPGIDESTVIDIRLMD